MKNDDTQSIALEVRGISSSLKNLEASRERHDKKTGERFDTMDSEIKSINEHLAASREFKRILIEEVKEMRESVKQLTALSHKAQGGWWAITALCTIISIVTTILGFKVLK